MSDDDPVKRAERLLAEQPPIDPSAFWQAKLDALPAKVAAMTRLDTIATELARREMTALDEGVVALLRGGAKIEQIEIVSETYSRGDDHTTIHHRAYVRVRPEGSR